MQDLLFNVFLDDGVGSNSLAESSFHICSKFNAKLDTQSLKLFLWNNSYLYSSIFLRRVLLEILNGEYDHLVLSFFKLVCSQNMIYKYKLFLVSNKIIGEWKKLWSYVKLV